MSKLRFRKAVVVTLVAALASVGLLVAVNYRSDIRQAHARVNTGGQVVDTPCGRIQYATAGGRGPSVLVVHGAGGGFDQGLALGTNLAGRGYRVIAMSRFGYLRTPLPADASPQAQADAHACLLDALDVDRAAIIGASAGAPSSAQFALRHPDRTSALILLVPAIYSPRPGASLVTPTETPPLFDTALRSDFLFWTATKIARRQLVRGILATPTEVFERASRAEQARASRVLQDILPVSLRRQGLVNDARITSALPRYELEKIGAPTLAISLEDDGFGTHEAARYSAQQIRGARFVSYPIGGHIWMGHHEDIADEIVQFLASSGETDRPAKVEKSTKDSHFLAGKALYEASCSACHQPDGTGVPGEVPPLAGSDFLAKGPEQAISVVLHGLKGKLRVHGRAYDSTMPQMFQLTDGEVADVLTFVFNSWGNPGGQVQESEVAAQRYDRALAPRQE